MTTKTTTVVNFEAGMSSTRHSVKKDEVIYWTSTGIVFAIMLWSGLNFAFNPAMKGAFAHFGLPNWFRVELTTAKLLGAFALLLPGIPRWIKSFAYSGFAITLVSASVAHLSSGDPLTYVIGHSMFLVSLIISDLYYHKRIDDPSLKIDERTMLFIRGVGPIGYPGSSEVVNMQPPAALLKKGITSLPCIGDGRQSGTSGSPSILNATPEAAAGGGLALLQTGDRVRIDLRNGTANILISPEELAERRAALQKRGGYPYPVSQTPWQEIQRAIVDQLADGMVLKPAVKYQRVAQKAGVPRNSH